EGLGGGALGRFAFGLVARGGFVERALGAQQRGPVVAGIARGGLEALLELAPLLRGDPLGAGARLDRSALEVRDHLVVLLLGLRELGGVGLGAFVDVAPVDLDQLALGVLVLCGQLLELAVQRVELGVVLRAAARELAPELGERGIVGLGVARAGLCVV